MIAVVFVLFFAGTAALGTTSLGGVILSDTQRFLLFYAGVFALIAMTATVGFGLLASDRIVMVPSTRVVAQTVHRALSLGALAFLVIHIVTEILAQRVGAIDAFIPFLAPGKTFYIGLGTIASDMLVVLIVTGLARSRFAGTRPAMWRAIHVTAYGCWFLSLLHGLLGGREGKPYVNWSYGVCVALVLLALTIRLVVSLRDRRETAPQPVPSRPSSAVPAAAAALEPLGLAGRGAGIAGLGAATMTGARALRRALPAAPEPARADFQEQEPPDRYPAQPVLEHPYQSPYPPQPTGYDPSRWAPPADGGQPFRQPYPDEPYDEEFYDDPPQPGRPDLWPDHPSAPFQRPGLMSGPPEWYPPSTGAERR